MLNNVPTFKKSDWIALSHQILFSFSCLIFLNWIFLTQLYWHLNMIIYASVWTDVSQLNCQFLLLLKCPLTHYWTFPLTHSEQRPQNIYSQEEINLYCIIKLATEISLFLLQISKTWRFMYIWQSFLISKVANLHPCRIVIFNLCICCQFEDLQIISPKIIPMSHSNI